MHDGSKRQFLLCYFSMQPLRYTVGIRISDRKQEVGVDLTEHNVEFSLVSHDLMKTAFPHHWPPVPRSSKQRDHAVVVDQTDEHKLNVSNGLENLASQLAFTYTNKVYGPDL